jgi:hypothetical protein
MKKGNKKAENTISADIIKILEGGKIKHELSKKSQTLTSTGTRWRQESPRRQSTHISKPQSEDAQFLQRGQGANGHCSSITSISDSFSNSASVSANTVCAAKYDEENTRK